MAVSNITEIIDADLQKVWNVVTSLNNFGWRSDLSDLKIISEKKFVEYSKDGYPTTFTITNTEPYKCWEFDMENDNMTGHWKGIFTRVDDKTEISFTEDVTAKKLIMRPFVRFYLKKQQTRYVTDLKEILAKLTAEE
ncbi:MAG: SRPBCC family protein [Lachnospiraceae bacterium]|nr:SRPBCC family protein [Lachnospiraceae bacterium]